MDPERSLLCSQQPATVPYPEPDESSSHPHFVLCTCLCSSADETIRCSHYSLSAYFTNEKPNLLLLTAVRKVTRKGGSSVR